jgi:hypothetical protein
MRIGLARLFNRIRQIGQKRKVEIVVAIPEVADLDIIDQLPRLPSVAQQCRNRNKGCGLKR